MWRVTLWLNTDDPRLRRYWPVILQLADPETAPDAVKFLATHASTESGLADVLARPPAVQTSGKYVEVCWSGVIPEAFRRLDWDALDSDERLQQAIAMLALPYTARLL